MAVYSGKLGHDDVEKPEQKNVVDTDGKRRRKKKKTKLHMTRPKSGGCIRAEVRKIHQTFTKNYAFYELSLYFACFSM